MLKSLLHGAQSRQAATSRHTVSDTVNSALESNIVCNRCCTYLAHHELASIFNIIVFIIVVIIIIILLSFLLIITVVVIIIVINYLHHCH